MMSSSCLALHALQDEGLLSEHGSQCGCIPGPQLSVDSALQDTAVLSTQGPAVWLNYWIQLAQGLAQNAVTANQIVIDGVNEPEVGGVRWEASSGGNAAAAVGYGALLLQLWDAVNPILPNALLFFEGTSQFSSQGECGRPGISGRLPLLLQLWETAPRAPVLWCWLQRRSRGGAHTACWMQALSTLVRSTTMEGALPASPLCLHSTLASATQGHPSLSPS